MDEVHKGTVSIGFRAILVLRTGLKLLEAEQSSNYVWSIFFSSFFGGRNILAFISSKIINQAVADLHNGKFRWCKNKAKNIAVHKSP